MTGEDLYKQFVKDVALQLSEAYPVSDLEPGSVFSGLLSGRCALFRRRLQRVFFAADLLAAHRFFNAATMAAFPAALSFRFGFVVDLDADSDSPLGYRPSFPLGIADALPGGGAHLPSFALENLRRGAWFRTATVQHGPELGNLSVETDLLLFKTCDGGADDFGSEIVRGHQD
jgi:hypothetical protein